jgi:hypothetical protein
VIPSNLTMSKRKSSIPKENRNLSQKKITYALSNIPSKMYQPCKEAEKYEPK